MYQNLRGFLLSLLLNLHVSPILNHSLVVVSGATGILGRVLILDLLRRGKKVRALKRRESDVGDVLNSFSYYEPLEEQQLKNLEWRDVDFQDLDSIAYALEGASELYHSLALVSFDPRDREALFSTNHQITQRLLYAVEDSSIQSMLYVSSIAVLDKQPGQIALDETSDFDPKQLHSAYSLSKYLSEMEVMRAGAEGLNVVVVQPGIILGSGGWKRSSGALFSSYQSLPYVPSGTGNYVDVRDVSRASIELMEKKKYGERYTLVAGQFSSKKVSDLIRGKSGLKPARVLPKSLLVFFSKWAPYLSFLIPPLRFLHPSNVKALVGEEVVSSEKIKKTLDFEFIPVEKSLNEHLDHFLSKGKIL